MQNMTKFPKNAKSFVSAYNKNYKLIDIFNLIGKPRPFDVTLRDGLQALNKNLQKSFTTDKKIEIYNNIMLNHYPKNIEIGSCVNQKVLPIFKDTEYLFNYVNQNKINGLVNNYILVPNFSQLQNALKFGVKNFSLITSISDDFQMKNTKMTIKENEENIDMMLRYIDDYQTIRIDEETGNIWNDYTKNNIKLYVSCINECPIKGKIDNSIVVDKLERLSKLNVNKICLSDTCGSLESEDFVYILRKCRIRGIDITKFSLHLHIKPGREYIAQELFFIALDNRINEFDVSELSTGGCSVTMDENKIAPNMNYEQYYRFLMNYLVTRSKDKYLN